MEILVLTEVLWRRKWVALSAVVFFVCVAVVASLALPESYEASTEVIVAGDDSAASMLNDLGLSEFAMSVTTSSDDIMNKIYLATSDPVVNETVRRLQLRDGSGYLYEAEDVADGGLLAVTLGTPTIVVSQVSGTDVLLIEATAPSAEAAALLADTVALVYVEKETAQERSELREAQTFIQAQLIEVTAQLDKAFANIAQVQRDNEIIDLETEVRAAVGRLSELLMEQHNVAAKVHETQARMRTARVQRSRESADAVSSTTLQANPVIKGLRTTLTELRAQRLALLANSYTVKAPEVIEIDARIAGASQQLDKALQVMSTLDPTVAELEGDLSGLQERGREIDANIRSTTQAFASYPEKMREISQLELAASAAEGVYRALQDQRFQIGIAGAMTMSDVRVVSAAILPESASYPKPLLNLLLGLLLGLGFGAGASFALEYVDDTIIDADALRQVWYLPALGLVPRFTSGALPALAELPHTAPLAEAFRAIRVSMRFAAVDQKVEVVGVTSAIPGEGKSTVAINLAVSMAHDGRRVLVVDADLRAPTQHRRFPELMASPGLAEVMSDTTDLAGAVQATSVPNLFVLAAGDLPANPGSLVASLRLRQALNDARREYDVVVVDTPPVLAVGDAIVLTRLVDGMVVVAESGRVTRRMLTEVRSRFEAAGLRPIGLVLNKVRTSANPYGEYTRAYADRSRRARDAAKGEAS